jgi:hypothetical protein
VDDDGHRRSAMTHINFSSVYCPGMAAVFEPIVLRVDEEEIFHGNIEEGGTLVVDVRIPIVSIKVEMGIREIDGLGNTTVVVRRQFGVQRAPEFVALDNNSET